MRFFTIRAKSKSKNLNFFTPFPNERSVPPLCSVKEANVFFTIRAKSKLKALNFFTPFPNERSVN